MSVSAIPSNYPPLTPYLIVKDGAQAVKFYQEALGANLAFAMPGPGGSVMHAELRIGSSVFMLGQECPAWGAQAPQPGIPQSVSLYLYVESVDAAFQKALDHGATQKDAVQDKFYGDRSGSFTDPFGHVWSLATHIEDVSHEEMQRRAEAMQKQAA